MPVSRNPLIRDVNILKPKNIRPLMSNKVIVVGLQYSISIHVIELLMVIDNHRRQG